MFIKIFRSHLIILILVSSMIIGSGYHYKIDKVIQIDVSAILNARTVTTLTKGKLITWSTGIDKENGYLTMAASTLVGDHDPHALPDNPLFPASKFHPGILLHYANENGTQYQTRCLTDTGEFIFKVPGNNYAELYLSLTSSYGESQLQIEMTYTDGVERKQFVLPDWYKDIPEDDPDLSS
jgi:hypothetical protein